MNDHRYMNSTVANQAAIDEGLRSYMLGVYNYMTTALAVTGLAAYGTKMLTVAGEVGSITLLTPLGEALYLSPLKWVVALAPLAMVFWLSARIHAMSVSKAQGVFYAFAALMGISLSSILIVYTGESVARAFFITAAAFASLSIYGYTTKRDLGPLGAFLMIGVVGLLLAMIVNMFVGSMGMGLLISVGGVLIFAGLTAYDTQKIKMMYMASDSHSTAQKKSIHGALQLYLDFINMFLFLLHLLGNRE
ncbi:Bax inhibitor-1/YccA family protein [Alphaproteobacteria bacterium]|jgi:FtsH-binding integral membrane protein|nr:Bax inhibitor-1/YccA family protein [Alphaproteobacteria bacterium]MDC1116172.1 Bax inhibitor-1/YccA family protein [Alphaproteobacteria bacterium]